MDDNNDIRHLHDLHKTMLDQNLILVYEGEFTQKITTSLLAMTEKKIELSGEEDNIKRKIFNVMMECLQNIVKHVIQEDNRKDFHSAIFAIGKNESDYFISTGNVVADKGVEDLKNRLNEVNSLDKEGLKKLYKEMILKGKITSGGAGLGLIDIARKSEKKLHYDFKHIEGNFWFYSLEVRISINN